MEDGGKRKEGEGQRTEADHELQESTQSYGQQTPMSTNDLLENADEPVIPYSTTMRPTLQTILWFSDHCQ